MNARRSRALRSGQVVRSSMAMVDEERTRTDQGNGKIPNTRLIKSRTPFVADRYIVSSNMIDHGVLCPRRLIERRSVARSA